MTPACGSPLRQPWLLLRSTPAFHRSTTSAETGGGQDLLAQDVGVAGVLGDLGDDMEDHPAQRDRAAAVAEDEVVQRHRCDALPRRLADGVVPLENRRDRVVVGERERLLDAAGEPEI